MKLPPDLKARVGCVLGWRHLKLNHAEAAAGLFREARDWAATSNLPAAAAILKVVPAAK